MKHTITLASFFLAILFIPIFQNSAEAQRISRPCPFNCQDAGFSDNECRDFREGDICTIVIDRQTASGGDGSNINDGRRRSQNVCLSEDGTLLARRNCRTRQGEMELNISTLSDTLATSIANISGGTTVYGVVGLLLEGVSDSGYTATSSLPGKASPTLGTDEVIVSQSSALTEACGGSQTDCLADIEVSVSENCTGTAEAPTAPEGLICIYPAQVVNATNIRAEPLPQSGGVHGFFVGWDAINSGVSGLHAVWAYTKPSSEQMDEEDSPSPTPTPSS